MDLLRAKGARRAEAAAEDPARRSAAATGREKGHVQISAGFCDVRLCMGTRRCSCGLAHPRRKLLTHRLEHRLERCQGLPSTLTECSAGATRARSAPQRAFSSSFSGPLHLRGPSIYNFPNSICPHLVASVSKISQSEDRHMLSC